jgi:hypothetical protein
LLKVSTATFENFLGNALFRNQRRTREVFKQFLDGKPLSRRSSNTFRDRGMYAPEHAFLNMINCDGLKATLIRCLMEFFWVSKQN